MHVDDRETSLAETMATFDRLVEAGKVRHVGASNYDGWWLARANTIAEERHLTKCSCVQPRLSSLLPHRYSDFDRRRPATGELVSYCDDHDLTMLPYSPLLPGRYGRDDRPVSERYVTMETRPKMEAVRTVANRTGVSGNQVVLARMARRTPTTIPIVGCNTVDQLEANITALDIELTDDDFQRLDSIETLGGLHRRYRSEVRIGRTRDRRSALPQRSSRNAGIPSQESTPLSRSSRLTPRRRDRSPQGEHRDPPRSLTACRDQGNRLLQRR
ncbi:aldo/keto reductase [Halosimplex litoreum]|uniref:Aldo/keto reductase n=1 Tax=Halosimplex litoreum TaxID=1198301 RepID=A0A7T3FWL4_9EURY|nr:aldo/keto reductase [Halosimplex litoreum]QPV61613.1 aldo/keto reductase [Halosimplex litoreum]